MLDVAKKDVGSESDLPQFHSSYAGYTVMECEECFGELTIGYDEESSGGIF